MKKNDKNTNTNGKTTNAAANQSRRANRSAAQQYNIGKYFGNSQGSQTDGNIYGESEEDYYSHG